MGKVVKLVDMAQFVGTMNTKMREGAMRGLILAGKRAVQTIVVVIIPSRSPKPVDRGLYRAGWRSEQTDKETVSIYNLEPHAGFIEDGVRPENVKAGFAMRKALYEWVIRKGIASDEQEAIGIVWGIVAKMKQRGIFNKRKGNGLKILAELNEDHLPMILKQECTREISRVIGALR